MPRVVDTRDCASSADVELPFTAEERRTLISNYEIGRRDPKALDPVPVAKLYNPERPRHTWLVCALKVTEPNVGWVVADIGMDCVEQGTVDLRDLRSAGVVRSRNFAANKTMHEYRRAARTHRQLTGFGHMGEADKDGRLSVAVLHPFSGKEEDVEATPITRMSTGRPCLRDVLL
jgi:hypothetical protein